MSLWKVPDIATAILHVAGFHENLLVHGLPRDLSLREASTHLRALTVGDIRDRWLTMEFIDRFSQGSAEARTGMQRLASQPDEHTAFIHPLCWGASVCQGDPAPLRRFVRTVRVGLSSEVTPRVSLLKRGEELKAEGDEVHLAYPGHKDPKYAGMTEFHDCEAHRDEALTVVSYQTCHPQRLAALP